MDPRVRALLASGQYGISGPDPNISQQIAAELAGQMGAPEEVGGPYAEGGPDEVGQPNPHTGLSFQHPTTPRLLQQHAGLTTMIDRGLDPRYGARFLREAGCSLTVTPIPVEARATPLAAMHVMLESASRAPAAPVIATAQFISPGPAFAVIAAPAPRPDRLVTCSPRRLYFVAMRVDFGLSGIAAAAATPIRFSVYTRQTGTLVVDDDSLDGTFNSQQIQITPFSNMEMASVVIYGYRVVQSQPLPKFLFIESCPADFTVSPPVGPQRELVLDVQTAPNNTTCNLTILTATHPSWQLLASQIMGGA